MDKSKILIGILTLVFLIVIVSAWTPTSSIDLRNYYNITNVPYYNGTDINLTGNYYGNGSGLTGVSLAETDPVWTAEKGNYTNESTIIGWGYYNLSDFNINDYYLNSNPFNFYNSTSIPSYILSSDEEDLNVNSSDYWNGYGDVFFKQATDFNMTSNTDNSFTISDSGVNYVEIDTTTGSEKVVIGRVGSTAVAIFTLNLLNLSDENVFGTGDIFGFSNINATNFYQDGNVVCDDSNNCNFILQSEESNLNVNNSDKLDGQDGSYYLDDTTIGNCSVDGSCSNIGYLDYSSNTGSFNVTSGNDICISGSKCLSETGTGGGDITAVLTDLTPYLLNGSSSGEIDLNFNETYLNQTIDARSSGGNFNESTSWSGDLGGTGSNPTVTWTNGNNKLTLKQENITNEDWIEDSQESNLNVNSSDYWDNLNTESDLTPSNFLSAGNFISYTGDTLNVADNWWNADGDISADEISESKIGFSTTCAAGNHLYISGNDLACEADSDTTYSAGDSLSLSGTTFNVDDDFIKNTGDTMGGDLNMNNNNVTSVDCITFNSGGEICSA